MEQKFNVFGVPEIPQITLCNPNKTELYSLALAYNIKLSSKFNAISELNFDFPKSISGINNDVIEAYDFIQNKRLVKVDGYGFYTILDSQEDNSGDVTMKSVSCRSLESELIQKTVVAYGGTKKLYDILNPTGTIIQDMLNLAPSWSAGTFSTELLTKFRTFNVSSSNILSFLTNDVATAFECTFSFNTEDKTISAFTISDSTKNTDIYLSFNNLIKKAVLSEKSDEITTCLAVYGGGSLDIRQVNPIGTSNIYNFDYYTNTTWMSQGLVNAITAWKTLVTTQQPIYSADLLLLETYNGDLLTLQSALATLNEEYLTLQGVQKARIQQNLPYADINTQLAAKQTQINAQNVLITNKQTQITNITNTLKAINTLVSFNTNFTTLQLKELDSFIYQNTYKNENIIQTDSMTLVEIQHQAQQLYDQAQSVLTRVSQPRYEIEMDSVNYIVQEDFKVFTNQTELGAKFTAEIEDGIFVETVLLQLDQDFNDPTQFKMTFSNRVRLDGANYTYSDLMGSVQKTGASVTFDSLKWSNWENNYKDDVTTFITSALDATTNNLVSNSNQEILINQNGLRARQTLSGGGYSLKQAWLVNNVLAFSNDGFQTSKLALGEIHVPTGGTAYGLVADVIVGKLLAGNVLTITNETNNFVLDSTGATLTNAKFTLANTNTKVIIDPTSTRSFRIQKNIGGTFIDQFWADNAGNVNFSGILSGATGVFSGSITALSGNIGTLVIDTQGLKTADGVNYLRGNGDLKWGALSITGSTAIFQGDIYANKLVGQVVDPQIASGLNAGKVTHGEMSGNQVFGGFIGSGGGGGINLTQSGKAIVQGTFAILDSTTGVAEVIVQGNTVTIDGSIAVDTGLGKSGTFTSGTTFIFRHGILIDTF